MIKKLSIRSQFLLALCTIVMTGAGISALISHYVYRDIIRGLIPLYATVEDWHASSLRLMAEIQEYSTNQDKQEQKAHYARAKETVEKAGQRFRELAQDDAKQMDSANR